MCSNAEQSSKVRSPSSWGFGSGDRFSQIKGDRPLRPTAPGPGHYVI